LLPLDEAWLAFLAGGSPPLLAKALCPAFWGALLLLFHEGARRLAGDRWAFLGAVLLGLVPRLFYWAASGYADVPLALFAFSGALYLALWLESGARRDLVLGVVLAALAAWTKREGLLVWAVLGAGIAGSFLLGRTAREARRALALHVVVGAVVFGPWLASIARAPALPRDFAPPGVGLTLERAARLPGLASLVGRELADPSHWAILWPVFPLSLLAARRPATIFLASVVALATSALACAYVFSTWEPWEAHVHTSFDRLVAQEAPAALLVVLVQLRGVRRLRGC
jgi:hypothetical protein